ncbi:5-(carboxyamino)imidazole ribonucleotide mutase [Thermoplasma sp. Kam2015]|uniref:5-(carboxyamino)imidazole ribonucleotide mutase n=1 Tax=Thermoplasma sp. Kam2015 TaxID=2094122 RepID=UPI000D9ACFCA|nr:5-(carboxyamino)imidazole ribonucleotide mutase [Thermoplasma sp. Kam2015]PYB68901.1 5-(carboxyamino)imidazole ribonucleotide mutase [Thermoplasma sp. Kam2015]
MPKVAVIMGSSSDYETMKPAIDFLRSMGVEVLAKVVSAHRTPEYMLQFASEARNHGIEVIIAGAGGAAHLPGMVASMTTLPVIGVPVPSKHLNGLDSLLSIVQMPSGIPVATVAIGNSKNAAILACRILSVKYPELEESMKRYMESEKARVLNESIE